MRRSPTHSWLAKNLMPFLAVAVTLLGASSGGVYAQIEDIMVDTVETPGYGILIHHVKVRDYQSGMAWDQLPFQYVEDLFQSLRQQDGPVKDELERIRKEQSCNPHGECNPEGLGELPSIAGHARMEFTRQGWADSAVRYRLFLTFTDPGSAHATRPVLALDFDMYAAGHEPVDGMTWWDVKTMLTGMGRLENARLAPVKGVPPPDDKCIGCSPG